MVHPDLAAASCPWTDLGAKNKEILTMERVNWGPVISSQPLLGSVDTALIWMGWTSYLFYLFTHPHRGNSVDTAADTCEITAWSSGGGGRSGQRKTGNRDGWKINSECQTSNSRQKANSLGCLSSGSRFEVNANWGKCAPGLCLTATNHARQQRGQRPSIIRS